MARARTRIAAKTVITDDAGGSVYVFCDLSVDEPAGPRQIPATMVGTASARQTVALELTHTFASAGTITLSCEPTNPANTTNVGAELTKIMAITVGNETDSAADRTRRLHRRLAMRRLHLTPSLGVAFVALVAAVSGGAYAAVTCLFADDQAPVFITTAVGSTPPTGALAVMPASLGT